MIKFRFVRLNNESIGSILIDREGQNFIFKANTRKYEKKISLANKEISEVINEIISFMTRVGIQYGDKIPLKIN